jgi:hypothetical protein
MAGAIIMAGAIVTGAIVTGAIIMVITVGETSLPSCGDYSGRSRLSLAAFSFEPRCLRCVATRKSRRSKNARWRDQRRRRQVSETCGVSRMLLAPEASFTAAVMLFLLECRTVIRVPNMVDLPRHVRIIEHERGNAFGSDKQIDIFFGFE